MADVFSLNIEGHYRKGRGFSSEMVGFHRYIRLHRIPYGLAPNRLVGWSSCYVRVGRYVLHYYNRLKVVK